jgi:hypothetical protein
MQTFLSTMADIGAETWIMHGTLLGWWWNQKVRVADRPITDAGPDKRDRYYRGTPISMSRFLRLP